MIDRYKKIVLVKKMVSNLPCPVCKQNFDRNNLIIKGEIDNLILIDSICTNHQKSKIFNMAISVSIDGIKPKTLDYDDYLDFKININKDDKSRA